MRRWTAGLVAKDGVESFDVGARVGGRLLGGGGIGRAPYLLVFQLVRAARIASKYPTWRALQERLKAVSRSVGDVAREGLDGAREPPMRRDHWSWLVLSVMKVESLEVQSLTKSILWQHGLTTRGGGGGDGVKVKWSRWTLRVSRVDRQHPHETKYGVHMPGLSHRTLLL